MKRMKKKIYYNILNTKHTQNGQRDQKKTDRMHPGFAICIHYLIPLVGVKTRMTVIKSKWSSKHMTAKKRQKNSSEDSV